MVVSPSAVTDDQLKMAKGVFSPFGRPPSSFNIYWDISNYPHIQTIISELTQSMDRLRCLDKIYEDPNPVDGDKILRTLEKKLSELSSDDLFIFWYLGHAKIKTGGDELELIPTGNNSLPLGWGRIVDVLDKFKSVAKVVVLDCCHAGMIRKSSLPAKTCIWPTTEANHTAEAGIIGSTDPGGKFPNFSFLCDQILKTHQPGHILTFEELFTQAQDEAIGNGKLSGYLAQGFSLTDPFVDPMLSSEPTVESLFEGLSNFLATK